MLSLVTLAVYLSASEVEVGKLVFYIETHHKMLEGLKATASWIFLSSVLQASSFDFSELEEVTMRVPSCGVLRNCCVLEGLKSTRPLQCVCV